MSLHDDYFRTLPREILSDTLYNTERNELLALCSTNRHIRNIYPKVNIYNNEML
jgi:hypothetical protein